MKFRRARDFAKLHHPDQSGFWRLVRTGESLPEVGQHVLFVHDIRGTVQELMHNMLVKVADGDPLRIFHDAQSRGQKIDPLTAAFFQLPTNTATPRTLDGVVSEVGFDETMQEHWILVKSKDGRTTYSPDEVPFWAPWPIPPDTYVPRTGDDDDMHHLDYLRRREDSIRDKLAERRAKRAQKDFDGAE